MRKRFVYLCTECGTTVDITTMRQCPACGYNEIHWCQGDIDTGEIKDKKFRMINDGVKWSFVPEDITEKTRVPDVFEECDFNF